MPSELPGEEGRESTILGFDIGGTKTAIVLGTVNGIVHERVEIPTPAAEPFERAVAAMLKAADALLEAKGNAYPAPLAISVAVGGPLDIEAGIIYSPPNLPTWDRAPLKSSLADHFHLPVFVEHDGNAGALAEFYFGAGQNARNLIYLTMGTGLGAGILLDGQIYRGSNDLAGETGHIRIAEDGPFQYGKAGSWEGYCSAAGMVQLAHLRNPERWPPEITSRQIIQQALSGDAEALALVHEMGGYLGKGIAVLVDILNPDLILVGTLGIVLGDLLLEPAREVIKREALSRAVEMCSILPARLGPELSNYSALIAAIDAYRRGRWVPEKGQAPRGEAHKIVQESLLAGQAVRQRTILLSQTIVETALLIVQTLRAGGKIIVFGNGGSAATAQHLAGELVGRYKEERISLPAMALTADSSIITCIGNDYAFEDVFSRQVKAFVKPEDLVIGITTSGRSSNVLKGLEAARLAGAVTLALTGEAGIARPVADYCLAVPSRSTARVQEEHDAILHAWCEIVDREFALAADVLSGLEEI